MGADDGGVRRVDAGAKIGGEAVLGDVARQPVQGPEPRAQRFLRLVAPDFLPRAALADDMAHIPIEPRLAAAAADEAKRRVEPGVAGGVMREQAVLGLGQQLVGGGFFEHGEMRRDACLERKPAQDILAEAVDGDELQPARRAVEHEAEQTAGAGDVGLRRGAAKQGCHFLAAGRLVAQQQVAQLAEDAGAHLPGSGFGVSEAADALRHRPCEQQRHHPARQERGFPAAGVGGKPDGMVNGTGNAQVL